MDQNKEVVKPIKFQSSKPKIARLTPIPPGFESLDDFEMNAKFPIVVFSSRNNSGDVEISVPQKLRDKGDSCIVGTIGD